MINSKYNANNTSLLPRSVFRQSRTKPVDKMLICLHQFKVKFCSCILPQIPPPLPQVNVVELSVKCATNNCNIGCGRGGGSLGKFIERISLNFPPVLLTVLSTIVCDAYELSQFSAIFAETFKVHTAHYF